MQQGKRVIIGMSIMATVAILVLVISCIAIVSKIDKDARIEAGKALRTVLSTSEQAITSWAKEHRAAAMLWANTDKTVALTQELLNTPRHPIALIHSPAQVKLREFLKPLYTTKDYPGYFVISKDFINLGSTRDNNIGIKSLLTEQKQFLEKIWAGNTALALPQKSDVSLKDEQGNIVENLPTMFVGAPIFDSSGKVNAVFTLRIDPFDDFTRILQRGRIGESGETYAFNRNGKLISESRFDDQLQKIGIIQKNQRGILNIEIRDPGFNLLEHQIPLAVIDRPFTLMAKSAVAGKTDSNLYGYRDYRGVKVVGAWTWIDALHFGVTTEIDVDEIYTNLRSTITIIVAFTALSCFLIIVLATLSIKSKLHGLLYQQHLEEQVSIRTRELRDSEERGRLILESAGEGIYGIDLNGNATFVNHAAIKMLGYDKQELIGKVIHTTIHHSYPDGSHYSQEDCPMYTAALDGTVRHISGEVFWKKDGSSFPVEYTSTPIIKDNEIVGAVVTFRDITEQYEVDKIKNEFIFTVSHELRTPLTSIRGSLGLVAGGVAGEVSTKANELINIAINNCQRLILLVNDILDIQKVEAGKMVFHMKPQPLTELLTQSIEINKSYGEQYDVTYNLVSNNVNAIVNVDGDRLVQVLSNLISNATKFSIKGNTVNISLQVQDDAVKVSVIDKGCGIPETFQSQIFEKFSQVDSTNTRQKQGTGLGLNISKKIIETMGGNIGFESQENQASTFFFTLPLVQQMLSPKNVRIA